MGAAKHTHRWHPDVGPTPGRLWRVLALAGGDVVDYPEIARRVWADEDYTVYSRDRLKVTVYALRKAGVEVVTVHDRGLRLKGSSDRRGTIRIHEIPR